MNIGETRRRPERVADVTTELGRARAPAERQGSVGPWTHVRCNPLRSRLVQTVILEMLGERQDIRPTVDDVRTMKITRRRVLEFSETADGKTFFIDGKGFDPARDDLTVQLGDVEEWTVRNTTQELHVFHIHQLDFLVTRFRGEEYDSRGLRDVVDVPYQKDGKPGEVTFILPFTNPATVGRFPFHCHILEHEDLGMMGNLVVKPRAR